MFLTQSYAKYGVKKFILRIGVYSSKVHKAPTVYHLVSYMMGMLEVLGYFQPTPAIRELLPEVFSLQLFSITLLSFFSASMGLRS